jgi:hypothetical protein
MTVWIRIFSKTAILILLTCSIYAMNHPLCVGYQIPWQVLDGGGAMWLSQANHKVSSSLGQSVIGTQRGVTKTVYAGFWSPWATWAVPVEWEEDDLNQFPADFDLRQNYPNPFNLNTVIVYALPKTSEVNIQIYNILGQKVKTLVDEPQTLGYKKIQWDGKDDNDNAVSSGIYFYRIVAGDFVKCRKMALLK